jgi:hypothetical protein
VPYILEMLNEDAVSDSASISSLFGISPHVKPATAARLLPVTSGTVAANRGTYTATEIKVGWAWGQANYFAKW